MYILIILILILILLVYLKNKYENPYKLFMIFGKKGSGKTTYLTKLAINYSKKGYKVFSNTEIYNTYYFNTDDIGFISFPENSVILIDEVGLVWNCRDFKSFKPEVRSFFKYQRQNKLIVYLTSQAFDIDKTLRNLCDYIYLSCNVLNIFSVLKKVNKSITISKNDDEDKPNFLTEDYNFASIFQWQFTFIPRYQYFFNSFNPPKLDPIQNSYYYQFNNLSNLQKLTNNYGYLNYIKTQLFNFINSKLGYIFCDFYVTNKQFKNL